MRSESIISDAQFQSLPQQDDSGMFMNRGSMARAGSIYQNSFVNGAPDYIERPSILEAYEERPSVLEVYDGEHVEGRVDN